jgi:penicillin-binding protein 1A
MGVRDSELNPVPSLALGTSPVTIKEMVSAYSTIANDGEYLEPRMVTSIEDRNGNVLAQFEPASPERALPSAADRTLIDVMRDVVNRGTGAAIRSRFGIRADVAGKTGTTQDNADGWFILMHPQLVAGAWVGFDDGRVTLGSTYWGEGAHTALPIVGDFYQRALRARLIDSRVKFATEVEPGLFDEFRDKLNAWFGYLFGSKPKAQIAPVPVRHVSPKPAPVASASVSSSSSSPGASVPANASVPRSVPPLLVAPGAAASAPVAASNAGSSGVPPAAVLSPASAAELMGVPQRNGGLPVEGPSATPTPSPDVPEGDSGTSRP